MIEVIKRDGRKVEFDKDKIVNAILKAMNDVDHVNNDLAHRIANDISKIDKNQLDVEEIQDLVEEKLMASKSKDVARSYVRYRYKRELVRQGNTTDKTINELLNGNNEYWNTENSNKNAKLVTTQRDYIAGITSTDIARRFLLPKEVVEAHDAGIIHQHDMDYMAQNALNNCGLINLDDMLQNGTVINGIRIDPQHRLLTATTVATQIITAVASSQYGGCTISLTHLAPFVRMSYHNYLKEIGNELEHINVSINKVKEIAIKRLKKEIKDAVQTFNYQINSMSTTNGQSPFLSVCMYLSEDKEYKKEVAMLIEEFLNQRILGMKNEKGVYVTQAFPKLLYVLEEDNISEDSKYWYLTELAAKCTAKRMVPDYISEKIMKENKINKNGVGDCFPCMGCRSFLTPDRIKGNPSKALNYKNGTGKYYGRFNVGVTTINLVDVALSSNKDFDKFWSLLDERCELCHKGLRSRIDRLEKVTSDVSPILWQDGAYARLEKGESLKSLIHGGYATASLGYIGLYECVKYMTGCSHTDNGIGEKFGLEVMQKLNDKCNEWKTSEDIDYSPYGSPCETTVYKFAKCLKKRFGIIEGITDHDYITNSYHVCVREKIDPFTKLKVESKFQKLSPGGAISYCECSDLTNNTEAVLEVIKFIYDNIMYAELNTKSDYCQVCGYDGEILIDENMEWYCPNCGNRNQNKMNVARRTCGYIGSHFWNYGRTEEIKERYVHLGGDD